MIKETVLLVCVFGICSAGITYNRVVKPVLTKPESKQNAIDTQSDDLEGAETILFNLGGFGGGGCGGGCGGGYNGYEAYGGYGGYGDYGGGYGGYGGYGDYGGYGGCSTCGGYGYGKK